MRKKVTIIDYGVGNTKSLKMIFEKLDVDVILTKNEEEIINSKYIILPGVGAFASAMEKIKKFKIDQFLLNASNNKAYILGICLGAQLFMTKSEEFGENNGLNLIPGEVKKILVTPKKEKIKLPHIGWSEILKSNIIDENQEKLLFNIDSKDSFYFIHSYICIVKNNLHELFHTKYEELKIPAIIGSKNIFGCQFHPEKSGLSGIKFMRNFINL
tara:strand:- start:533 stop:1174 length:642 start_codon:yes stop_codon:yes gene_type:complete